MPDGVILHREQLPASGTWQVRPPALAGITPIAYLAFGTCVTYPGDDVLAANSGHFVSMGDGSQSYCAAGSHEDALASSNNACSVARDVLLYLVNPSRADSVITGQASLVSGGLDVVITQADIRPLVTFLFIYSDTWETFTAYQAGLTSGTAVHPTGFTGSDNDNQIFFFLTDIGATSVPQRDLASSFVPTVGCAYRQGAAGAPAAQWVMPVTNRDNRSSGELNNRIFTDSVQAETSAFGAVNTRHSISDISDGSITIAWQEGSTNRRGMFVLGLNTKDKKCWAGVEDSLNSNGNWIVNTPGFQPEVVVGLPNQQTIADGTGKTADLDVGGWIAGTASAESSAIWAFEDAAANMVAKSREDNQFLNVLQDDASDGWRSGAADFSLTATGFRVDNVVVDGGGGGAPLTTRKWPMWAIEGISGPPPPVNIDIQDLRHSRPVDQVDVSEIITIIDLDVDSLRHARRVDGLTLGVIVDLFLSSMRHRRPVDALAIDVSVALVIDALRHGREVDVVDVQPLVGVVLDVESLRHRRPVDMLLLDVEQPIVVDNVRHGRPVDTVGVQPLLGDQTGIGASAANWILDAGQPLNNVTSIDFDYHVLEGVFDADQSVLGVDGARVTGPAGMRELTALTLGANVDGQERVQGEIAELRIYAGALSQADRDRIIQELQAKWVTG